MVIAGHNDAHPRFRLRTAMLAVGLAALLLLVICGYPRFWEPQVGVVDPGYGTVTIQTTSGRRVLIDLRGALFAVATVMIVLGLVLRRIKWGITPMRFPKITIRRLMIAVMVLALPLGLCMERRSRFLAIAESHRQAFLGSDAIRLEIPYIHDVYVYDSAGRLLSEPERTRKMERSNWHFALEKKYREAALMPWLPVPPDPPEPD